jgi:hypothetical protein
LARRPEVTDGKADEGIAQFLKPGGLAEGFPMPTDKRIRRSEAARTREKTRRAATVLWLSGLTADLRSDRGRCIERPSAGWLFDRHLIANFATTMVFLDSVGSVTEARDEPVPICGDYHVLYICLREPGATGGMWYCRQPIWLAPLRDIAYFSAAYFADPVQRR